MGKIYDNWGTLVEAVQRRERDRELAMCHSRDHSLISTDDGSTSSSTRFSLDHPPVYCLKRDKLLETNNFLGVDHYYCWNTSPIDPVVIDRIQDEFRAVVYCHPTEPYEFTSDGSIVSLDCFNEVSESKNIHEFHLIPSAAFYDLRRIADRMIAEGFLGEYVQVYASVRKSFIDASLEKIVVDELRIGDFERLEWETLEIMIWRWTIAAKMCVRVLFAGERRLCKDLFEGLGNEISVEDVCFMETVKGSAIQLFGFADAVSTSQRSPERLFKILDLHDTLSELLPDIESVFDSKFGESIRIWVVEIVSRLSEAVRGIILEFENLVSCEPSIVPVSGGRIPPLTRYVMNYVTLMSDYKLTLSKLIVLKPSTVSSSYSSNSKLSDPNLSEFEGDGSTLALHLIWIMDILQSNLYGKSRHYKDISLANLFMMNNIHYIRQKIKLSPELSEMIGDDYLRSLIQKLRSAATYYQRATWSRLLHCLRDDGIIVSERFKSFNAIFEEVHITQAMWLIPDTQLREELRISISEKLIPAYRTFCGRFGRFIENGRRPKNYMKYTVEDLEKSLFEDFFEGSSVSRHLRKTK